MSTGAGRWARQVDRPAPASHRRNPKMSTAALHHTLPVRDRDSTSPSTMPNNDKALAAPMSVPNPLPELPHAFPIHWRGDLHYEHMRVGRVFNLRRPERYPLAVVEAKREEHIVEAVKLAKKLGCRVAVRSGGHSWAVWSVRDDTILIDLGRYYELSYDAATQVAKVSPSTTGRMLNTILGHHGRLFPGGHCPDVGIGGFALQGGMGWNCKVRLAGHADPCPWLTSAIELGLGV